MEVFLECIERAFCLQFILDEVPARSSADILTLLWVLWAGLCLWCLLLTPAGGRNSQEMLLLQFSCLAWLPSLGAFPLPAPRCHILQGPNGVTASCCAGGTSRLGHFPLLQPWRDYFRSVPLVLLWMTSSSWNHRVLKVGKDLQEMTESSLHLHPTVAIKPSSATSAWHLDTSRDGDSTASLGEEGNSEIKSHNFMATGWTLSFS